MESILLVLARGWSELTPGSTDFFIVMFLVILGLSIAGVWMLILGWKYLRLRWVIKTLPTSKIASLPAEVMFADGLSATKGLFEVYGKVVPREAGAGEPELIKTPFTDQPCVYYEYQLTETRGSGKGRQTETLAEEKVSKPFYLEDETGCVTILLTGATIKIEKGTELTGTEKQPFPANFYTVLNSKGIRYHPPCGKLLHTRVVHNFREKIIKPGDWLYILGPVSREGEKLVIKQKERPKFWDIFYVADQPERNVLRSATLLGISYIMGSIIAIILIIITLVYTCKWF